MKNAFAVFCVLASWSFANAQSHTLITNLEYRLQRGDLHDIAPAPLESLRGLRIEHGADVLLADCLAHPEKWSRDPFLYRLGHKQPTSTIGCREMAAPSMHVVFYLKEDGSREAWIHFDLSAPHDLVGHTEEVLRNRLTLGHTSQDDVYRSFVEHNPRETIALPPRSYDYSAHLTEYLTTTLSSSSMAAGMFSATASSTLGHTNNAWGYGASRFRNHFEENIAKRAMQKSIEFGFASLLQQDDRFTASTEDDIGRRVKYALYHSFFVPGHNGNEFAFPRLAAAVGTGWIEHTWHPWERDNVNAWVQTSTILSGYVARSLWTEFKPEIKHELRKVSAKLRRN